MERRDPEITGTADAVNAGDPHVRLEACARQWRVAVEQLFETESSLIAYGGRAGQPVVLKVVRKPGDEWRSGEVVRAFDGHGMVRALEYDDGAVLLERLDPGTALVELCIAGRDEEATSILADVIRAMEPDAAPRGCPTVSDWGRGFARYRESGDRQLPSDLVIDAERVFSALRETQRAPRLLHGDLQHYNVLFDASRGWVAIDPKGVVGELEYELGAFVRNPAEQLPAFAGAPVVRSRLERVTAALGVDLDRAIAWSYAQAVLSVIWGVEDGYRIDPSNPTLALAHTIRPLVRLGTEPSYGRS